MDVDKRPYSKAADVYSFAILLYMVYMEKEPYDSEEFRRPWREFPSLHFLEPNQQTKTTEIAKFVLKGNVSVKTSKHIRCNLRRLTQERNIRGHHSQIQST